MHSATLQTLHVLTCSSLSDRLQDPDMGQIEAWHTAGAPCSGLHQVERLLH